jgi:hypothetical protein
MPSQIYVVIPFFDPSRHTSSFDPIHPVPHFEGFQQIVSMKNGLIPIHFIDGMRVSGLSLS